MIRGFSRVKEYSETNMPLANSVSNGTEVFNTTYKAKMRSDGTQWTYLDVGKSTISSLPLANTVPLGTRFIITDLGTGSALFYSNGSYWLPCGEATLFVDNVGATLTTTTTETVLATFTLNKKLASPNMTIVVNSLWSLSSSANNKTPRVRFGGVSGTEYINPQLTTSSSFQSECLIRFRNALNSQVGMASAPTTAYGASGVAGTTSTLDMATTDAEIVMSGQLANSADSLTLRAVTITLRG